MDDYEKRIWELQEQIIFLQVQHHNRPTNILRRQIEALQIDLENLLPYTEEMDRRALQSAMCEYRRG
jgi:hypothetical protein